MRLAPEIPFLEKLALATIAPVTIALARIVLAPPALAAWRFDLLCRKQAGLRAWARPGQ
jgi:hypothetical protein